MRKSKIIIGLGLILVLAFTSACTPNEVEQIEGILQNVDAASGEITIVTKDGQTMTFNIDTEASVETEGESSTLETLEVGASIQVEVNEDNQVVQRIKAHQAEVEGVIIQINGAVIHIAQINFFTFLFRKGRSHNYFNPWFFNTIFHRTDSAHMCGVG